MSETREQFRERIGRVADDAFPNIAPGMGWDDNPQAWKDAQKSVGEAVYATALRDLYGSTGKCPCQNCHAIRRWLILHAQERDIDLEAQP